MTKRIAGITSYRVPPAACPACHTVMDSATGTELDARACSRPKPGNLTVCANCKALLAFTDTMTLRLGTQTEFDQLAPELQRLVAGYMESGL